MTILNLANDGIYPELISIFQVIAKNGPIEIEEVVRICSADRAPRSSLTRWTELGLFEVEDKNVKLAANIVVKRGESLDSLIKRLPAICRRLMLEEKNCLPIWNKEGLSEDGTGRAADIARGLAWVLAQDIYEFSDVSADKIESIERQQIKAGKFVFLNKTRWPGLRSWARYLGFAVGDERTFFIDPTSAVRDEMPSLFHGAKSIPITEFLTELGARLPVFDDGAYRKLIESNLNEEVWRRVPDSHISMSLSLALRRLELDKTIAFEDKADAGHSISLTGRNYRTWSKISHIRLLGGKK